MTAKYYSNIEIAELLRSVAAAYELKDAERNKFRIIAYERAADAVEHATSELKDLWDEGKLAEVPGIGPNIASHLDELFRKGRSKHFDEVMKGYSPNIFKLIKIQGIGPKTAYKLVTELGLEKSKDILKDVEKVSKKGRIAKLEGFGETSQAEITKSIVESKDKVKRILLPYAESIAYEVISWMKSCKAVERIDPLGSLRRKASTVGDIDLSVASDQPQEAIEHFTNYPKAKRVLEKGDHTASIIVTPEIQIDLMVQPVASYGALLQHFTGSKHHNIALREYAMKKGLSLSEYGIKNRRGKLKSYKTEEEFYQVLDMEWIPPELREDTGEIEVALNHKIPKLVELPDIKCDLQIHSDFDIETSHDLGESSMEEIIEKGNSLSYEYLAFTEHNPSKSGHSEKKIVELIKRKNEAVEKLNYSLVKDMKISVKKVFNSLEIDIMPDGSLPVPQEAFGYLDFALVSIHSSFRLSRNEMTKRILSALAYPKVKIFAHPTARKINEREGVELNWPEIFEFCRKNNKWIEINADPMRLDLPDNLVKEAIDYGIKLTLGTDAHHKDGLENIKYGVYVARRGWAKANDIINTQSLEEFEKLLKGGDK